MNRWTTGFITGAMLVLPFAVFILLIQSAPSNEPNTNTIRNTLQVPVSTQAAAVHTAMSPLQTYVPALPSTNPTVSSPTPAATKRVVPIVTVVDTTREPGPYFPGTVEPSPTLDPTQIARLPAADRLKRIFEGGAGTVVARNIDGPMTPDAGSTARWGPIVRGYVIEYVPVEPPIAIESADSLSSSYQLCTADVQAPCLVDKLWRITIIGEGFSSDYPVGGLSNPSPVSIWIDGVFLGYGWRNGYDAEDGATILIHDAAPLKEGSIFGIGQGQAPVALQSAPTPSPPEHFTKPLHFIKTPTP